jgi:flagellin
MQIQVEVSQLVSELDRIASSAQFNGYNMLTGRFAEEGITFHVGANVDQNIKVTIGDMSAKALGLKSQQGDDSNTISVSSTEESNVALAQIDEALKVVNKQRANLGAVQNRMELAQKGINIAAENMTASESRIRDTDFAETMVDYTKYQILSQSASAMLAQANSNASLALQLLK